MLAAAAAIATPAAVLLQQLDASLHSGIELAFKFNVESADV